MKLIRALFKRVTALALAFVFGVSATMLWVYSLSDKELGSTRFDLVKVKEDALVWWHQPHALHVFVPPKPMIVGKETSCILPNLLTLVVSVDEQRRVALNGNEFGTLDDTSRLAAKLTEFFQERAKSRAYKEGITEREDFSEIPEDERIEKTVYVKAHHSLKYDEVLKLIDDLKGVGADPIGLQIDRDLFWTFPE